MKMPSTFRILTVAIKLDDMVVLTDNRRELEAISIR